MKNKKNQTPKQNKMDEIIAKLKNGTVVIVMEECPSECMRNGELKQMYRVRKHGADLKSTFRVPAKDLIVSTHCIFCKRLYFTTLDYPNCKYCGV